MKPRAGRTGKSRSDQGRERARHHHVDALQAGGADEARPALPRDREKHERTGRRTA